MLIELLVSALPLQFAEEHIDITVLESAFTVDSEYVFRRADDGALSLVLSYPFPEGAQAEVLEVTGAAIVAREPDALKLALSLAAEQREARVKVRYRQALGKRHARYLVTTALHWGAALERATFTIRAPAAWGAPRETSWPSPRRVQEGQTAMLRWQLSPFRPVDELDVRWP